MPSKKKKLLKKIQQKTNKFNLGNIKRENIKI